ncbi:sensor histidine kinase [Romeriopsis navalis]|nr:HAMP domain-containing histidine kinase [Romeriopsis navalis]
MRHFFATEAAFDVLLRPYRERADRIMVWMQVFLCVVCFAIAPIHNTFKAVGVIALPTLLIAYGLSRWMPGALATRIYMGCGFMTYTGLIIHQSNGQTEAHFSAFGLIGILLYYRDWRTIIAATVFIYLHHLILGYLQSIGGPIYVFASSHFWAMFGIHVAYFLPFIGMMAYLSIWLRREGYENQQDLANLKRAEAVMLEKSQALENTLNKLEQTQIQVVQSEKMAVLGNMVAGVAHEINNPIGFLNGSIKNAEDYIQDLLGHIALYQEHYPDAVAAVQEDAEAIDLEFIQADLPKLLTTMQSANQRIKSMSTSLRIFSRADKEHKIPANLHDGIDSTILILKYRLKASPARPAIQVVTEYGPIPEITCFPGQLNQVFMNILANAIDVFDEVIPTASFNEIKQQGQQITISTSALPEQNLVEICIRDNGKGMTAAVKSRIFDHLFTTKAVGKGTGLGMAITHQIVVDTHGGSIDVQSEVGQGTAFVIRLPIAS